MALVVRDRVRETTNTTGTGTYTLVGAVGGFESFASVGNGNTTYYVCTDDTDFEVGIGTYTASGTTLARTTILESSNSDNAVNWGAGSKDIFVAQPAEKAVYLDASDQLVIAGTSVTSTAAELSILSGVTATSTEINYLDITTLGTVEANKAVTADSNADVNFGDSDKLTFGAGTDLQIFHDGSNSYVQDAGTGAMRLGSDSIVQIGKATAWGELMASFTPDGGCELRHDNSAKLNTSASGIDVTGTVQGDSFTLDNGSNDWTVTVSSNNLRFNYAGTAKMELSSAGVLTVVGDIISEGTIS
jgi:hypothetical protein